MLSLGFWILSKFFFFYFGPQSPVKLNLVGPKWRRKDGLVGTIILGSSVTGLVIFFFFLGKPWIRVLVN